MLPRTIALSLVLSALAHGALLNPAAVDPNLFRVTLYASSEFAGGMLMRPDGSLLVAASPSFSNGAILRFTDTNFDGVADGPGTVVFSGSNGPYTQIRDTGRFVVLAEQGITTLNFLSPGANPNDPYTSAGTLEFNFGTSWLHNTLGVAVRSTPGNPNAVDLFVNIGARGNDIATIDTVGIQGLGLGSTQLAGDSIYRITIDQSGAVPVIIGSPQQVVAGIRNAYGMTFDPNTGDLYFADNAIDLSVPPFEDPPQADELNVLSAGQIGNGAPNYGYPNCYIAYITGVQVGSGCQLPLAAFQPLNGYQTEGPGLIAFAPSLFPAGLNNGVFVGFFGQQGAVGANNTESGVVYYDLGSGQYIHFIESGNPDTTHPISLLSTSNSLFVADFGTGNIFQITSTVPEPGTMALFALGLVVVVARRRA